MIWVNAIPMTFKAFTFLSRFRCFVRVSYNLTRVYSNRVYSVIKQDKYNDKDYVSFMSNDLGKNQQQKKRIK